MEKKSKKISWKKMENTPVELLNLLALSEKRRKVLLLLGKGPMTLEELRSSVKTTSSGLLPQIRKLEKADLVYQNNQEYGLTEIGEVMAQAYYQFSKTLEVIWENKDFWKERRIDGIPKPFRERINELGSCMVLQTTPTDIYEPHKEFMKNLATSIKIRAISPIYHPDFPHVLLELAKGGVDGSFIVTREVFERVKKEYEEELRNFLGFENINLMVCDEDIGVAFTVTDIFLSLGLFLKDGSYGIQSYLICFEDSALNWGEDLFNYYKERSRPILKL